MEMETEETWMKEECWCRCLAGHVEGSTQILAFIFVSQVEYAQRCRPCILVISRLISAQQFTTDLTNLTPISIVTHKDVVRLQFKRRQSGQVKRPRHVSWGTQGAERGRVRRMGVALPLGEGFGEGARARSQIFYYYLTPKWSILVLC